MKLHTPKFYRWDTRNGAVWAFGWKTGGDNDLICIKRCIKTTREAEMVLSPICSTKLLAISAFVAKVMLSRIDHNLRVRRFGYDNPSRESGNQ